MAETKILDLDALIGDEPAAQIKWRGQEHEVLGLTVETYLRAQQLAQAPERSDADQFMANLDFLFAIVPSLADRRAELLRLKLPALQKLLEFTLEAAGLTTAAETAATVTAGDAPAAGAGEPGGDLGESQPPA